MKILNTPAVQIIKYILYPEDSTQQPPFNDNLAPPMNRGILATTKTLFWVAVAVVLPVLFR